jgi:hypothetical protein
MSEQDRANRRCAHLRQNCGSHGTAAAWRECGGDVPLSIPQQPEVPHDLPQDEPPNPGGPTDTPPEYPGTNEPDYRAPGAGDAPFRLPNDNADVETEI